MAPTKHGTWTLIGLLVLAVPNLVTGLWAMADPRGWYDNFPGWAPELVAAYPPYNEHLVTDAGAGLFAAGSAALTAVLWPRREVVIVAMVVFLAFSVPHALFHTLNPSDDLSALEDFQSTFTLVVSVAVAVAILVDQVRPRGVRADNVPAATSDQASS